jgi:ubiquinone/menaquinone biosynthesis C-methylase UbiE
MHGTGKVYAIEVQKDLLTRLQNTCKEEGLGNVSFIWGNLEKLGGTKIRDGECDLVILSNVLFQVWEKRMVVEEAKRVLHPGGLLLIIDWTASFNNMGPIEGEVFPEAKARTLAEELHFLFNRSINAGNYHYGLIMRKVLPQMSAKPTTAHL